MGLLAEAIRARKDYRSQSQAGKEALPASTREPVSGYELNELNEQRSDQPWDQGRADKTLAEALQTINRAKWSGLLTEVQHRVLDLFGGVFKCYHAERNPLLWDATGDIKNQLLVIWGLGPATIGGGVGNEKPGP